MGEQTAPEGSFLLYEQGLVSQTEWSLMEATSNHLGALLLQVGRESFWLYKVYTRTIIATFLHGGWVITPCKSITMSLGVTLGQEVKEETVYSATVLLVCQPSCLGSHKDVVLSGF